MNFRRKIGEAERKEIEILKKISHTHMIRLIGTYTHRQSLGLLLSPVAVCDLHTYFEDVEAFSQGAVLDDQQRARLTTLGHISQVQPPLQPHRGKASSIYRNIGCLVSTVAYLHEKKIRHKDLKPSNILLVPGGFYLSDFGSATDFSLLSQSATENERGTPRYYAPEVAECKPNGRAADIFSLGCVLLEIITLDAAGTLNDLRQLRTSRDLSFHANLEKIDKWLAEWIISDKNNSPRQTHLKWEIRGMLARDPEQSPKAQELLKRVQPCDDWGTSNLSIFGDCCRTAHVLVKEHDKTQSSLEREIAELHKKLESASNELNSYKRRENEFLRTKMDIEKERNLLKVEKDAWESLKAQERMQVDESLMMREQDLERDKEELSAEKRALEGERAEHKAREWDIRISQHLLKQDKSELLWGKETLKNERAQLERLRLDFEDSKTVPLDSDTLKNSPPSARPVRSK